MKSLFFTLLLNFIELGQKELKCVYTTGILYKNGKMVSRVNRDFDTNLNLVKATTFEYSEDGSERILIETRLNEYNNYGNLIKTTIKLDGKLKEVRAFHDNQELKESIIFDRDELDSVRRQFNIFGKLLKEKNIHKEKYITIEYNSKGNILLQTTKVNLTNYLEIKTYEYNNFDDLIKKTTSIDINGTKKNNTTEFFYYDNNKNLLQSIKGNSYTKYEYNHKNLLVKKEIYIDNILHNDTHYEYNEQGKIIRELVAERSETRMNELMLREEYQYDSRGNIAKHLTYQPLYPKFDEAYLFSEIIYDEYGNSIESIYHERDGSYTKSTGTTICK